MGKISFTPLIKHAFQYINLYKAYNCSMALHEDLSKSMLIM